MNEIRPLAWQREGDPMDNQASPMASDPKTSVIIPVHNTAQHLGACLESVLSQTQKEIEVIVVDDGSIDDSLMICDSFANRDKRIRIVRQGNQGPGAARNKGLALARGEYVYFLDSDDLIVPDLFERCYRACKEHDLDIATFDSWSFVDDPDEDRSDLFRYLRSRSGMVGEGVMDGPSFWGECWSCGALFVMCWLSYINRSFALMHDLWFAEGICYEDNDWSLRLFMAAERVQYLPHTLHRYRHRLGSITRRRFSYDLARSCIEVHKLLCELTRTTEDPIHLEMIENTSYLHREHFLRFSDIIPTKRDYSLVEDFLEELIADCKHPTTPEAVRYMHIKTLGFLADGVLGWPKQPVRLTKQLLGKMIDVDTTMLHDSSRVGIYGTGAACEMVLWLYEPNFSHLFFLETDPEARSTFHGRPVVCIADAKRLELDAVVITSDKYGDQMRAAVNKYLGANMPVVTMPRCILALRDDRITKLVEHATTRRVRRRLRGAKERIMRRRAIRALRRFVRRRACS